MASSDMISRRNIGPGTKARTGCHTCRIRKVKCDENKPSCQKCLSTGRTCNGYESPFRFCIRQPGSINVAHAGCTKPDLGVQSIRPTSSGVSLQNAERLCHYFSTKTIFDTVKLGCDEEAKQILEASLTDPPIRHAILSLQALREGFEMSGNELASVGQIYNYGLHQYNIALGGLASKLSFPGLKRSRSALLCCQMFISIEQVQGNYAAMVKHMIQGLGIINEYRARPKFPPADALMRARQLPSLDIFIVKLFAAPCKFADPPVATEELKTISASLTLRHQQSMKTPHDLRTIVPDMRTALTKISESTLDFLDKVSHWGGESAGNSLSLLHEKDALLRSLGLWLVDLELIQTQTARPSRPEPISVSFMRLFHQALRIVIIGAPCSLSDSLSTELKIENDRLQSIANSLEEKVRKYEYAGSKRNQRGWKG